MSTVATVQPAPDTGTDQPVWSPTAEGPELLRRHARQVQRQFVRMGADPALVKLLLDPTILGTADIQQELGYTLPTRVFQLYSDAATLAADDQVPHPRAIPDPDSSPGRRGGRPIRGVHRGRFLLWCVRSGRLWWDSINKELVRQTSVNYGGASRRP